MATLPHFASSEEEKRFEALLAIAIAGFREEHASMVPKTVRTRAARFCSSDEDKEVDEDEFVFSTADDAFDHSPDAPFELNLRELLAAPPPRSHIPYPAYDRDDLTIDDFTATTSEKIILPKPRVRKPPSVPPSPPSSGSESAPTPDICYFDFGRPRCSTIICDPVTRVMLRAHPLFTSMLYIEPHVSKHGFCVDDTSDGRGKGLFATRLIARGEVIVREPPLLVQPSMATGLFIASFDDITTIAFHKRAAEAFDALHDCWPVNKVSRRWGTARTNQFGISFPFSKETLFAAIFEILSRANHSCAPNTEFSWDYNTFQGLLTAKKNIMPGDEITVTYGPNCSHPKKVRRERLQKKYNFRCTCTACGPD